MQIGASMDDPEIEVRIRQICIVLFVRGALIANIFQEENSVPDSFLRTSLCEGKLIAYKLSKINRI